MLEIRFHGRGGQGTVMAVKMLADAVLRSGKGECMAIPEFGVERRGAPVRAYARISDEPIRVRTRIYNPDLVIVMDPTFAEDRRVAEGLKPNGTLLINSERSPAELTSFWKGFTVVAIDAKKVALAHGLGSPAAPMVNTAMMGALCAAMDVADLPSLEIAIRDSVPVKIDENLAAAREGYAACKKEGAHAAS